MSMELPLVNIYLLYRTADISGSATFLYPFSLTFYTVPVVYICAIFSPFCILGFWMITSGRILKEIIITAPDGKI